ncbi:MAG TPA: DUF192 domain-containing protein [Candidatus Binataceae bacterium]|nr:DUF192 domain-containing protein [Candidatus Binataceae bacterium]
MKSARLRVIRDVLVVLLAHAAIAACTHSPAVSIVAPDGRSLARVRVEVVSTPAARNTGLMYRNHLDEDAGMLFVFAEPGQLQFYMKNTEIPLDMIFVGSDRRVLGIVANAEPYSEKHLGVRGDSLYVLEVNGGFAARRGIAPGDRFEFLGFTPRAAN